MQKGHSTRGFLSVEEEKLHSDASTYAGLASTQTDTMGRPTTRRDHSRVVPVFPLQPMSRPI